jgi:TRAP-type mannitol/chloroaromatic compound transport system permease large subunit
VAWALAGVSIAFSFIAIFGFEWFGWDTYFLTDFRIFGIFVQRIWGQMSNWILVALPMFIFMGLMLERSGVTEKLMENFIQLFGRFRGGLALGVVLIGILAGGVHRDCGRIGCAAGAFVHADHAASKAITKALLLV